MCFSPCRRASRGFKPNRARGAQDLFLPRIVSSCRIARINPPWSLDPLAMLLAGDLGLDSRPNWSERAIPFHFRCERRTKRVAISRPPPDTVTRLSSSLPVAHSTGVDSHDGRNAESGLSWLREAPVREDTDVYPENGSCSPDGRNRGPFPLRTLIAGRIVSRSNPRVAVLPGICNGVSHRPHRARTVYPASCESAGTLLYKYIFILYAEKILYWGLLCYHQELY